MSLLDSGPGYEACTVYLEESVTDADGNTMLRASATGIPAVARFQIQGQGGTSSRRSELSDEGYFTERVYTMRFPRSFGYVLGSQSQVDWDGARWSVFGDVQRYNSSSRTSHQVYTIRRF